MGFWITRTQIGDVEVILGEPIDGNPYKGPSLTGDERVEALRKFRAGEDTSAYTFWHAPAGGGAFRISADRVIWSG